MEKTNLLNQISVHCANDKIWNHIEVVRRLNQFQGQDINITFLPESIDLDKLGLYTLLDCFDFKSVTIHTHNPFSSHVKYNIEIQTDNEWLSQPVTVDETLHDWTGNRTFIACYGRPAANRIGLASYLWQNHRASSHIQFSAGYVNDSLELYEFEKLLELRQQSAIDGIQMLPSMPMTIAPTAGYLHTHYEFNDPITNFYKDILIDIVSETHVTGQTFFVTEKTTRPMWLKKPFVMFASRDYLVYLRQLGFKTFYEFWDEEYDGYEDRDRFERIIKLIDTLASKSTQELTEMYQSMQSILDHNYNLLVNQTYTRTVKLIT